MLIVCLCGFTLASFSVQGQPRTLDNLKDYIDNIKKQPAIAIAKLPDLHPITLSKTQQQQQRDPFVALAIDSGSTELAQYALASMKLVGTLIQQQHRLALLQTPRRIVFVTTGQIIGTEAVKLIAIMPKYIKLQSTNEQQTTRYFILQLMQ